MRAQIEELPAQRRHPTCCFHLTADHIRIIMLCRINTRTDRNPISPKRKKMSVETLGWPMAVQADRGRVGLGGQTRLGGGGGGVGALSLPWSRNITSLVPSVRPSEPILATLNALMVECTERIGRLTDRRGRDGRDSNVQSRFINRWSRTSCRGLIARQRFGCRTFSSEETGRGKERKAGKPRCVSCTEV